MDVWTNPWLDEIDNGVLFGTFIIFFETTNSDFVLLGRSVITLKVKVMRSTLKGIDTYGREKWGEILWNAKFVPIRADLKKKGVWLEPLSLGLKTLSIKVMSKVDHDFVWLHWMLYNILHHIARWIGAENYFQSSEANVFTDAKSRQESANLRGVNGDNLTVQGTVLRWSPKYDTQSPSKAQTN